MASAAAVAEGEGGMVWPIDGVEELEVGTRGEAPAADDLRNVAEEEGGARGGGAGGGGASQGGMEPTP